ncbi:MAG: ATP-binding cassette domain-containing protein, partial [Nitrospiraceae bacterium]|nr:ATP-binding cassette domain-containing protein [Nitrospiraceae bacterium]
NLRVKKGEVVGIIGRNTSGKSTLMKIIAGIIKPDTGRVIVKGRVLPIIELGVGFNPELTGRENIYLYGSLLGIPKKRLIEQLDNIIEFSELGRFINTKLKYYSSGMITRLAFSIAIAHEPDIILLDEILAVGDAPFQQKCIKKILDFKKAGKTILFVSHNADQIKLLCDRVILLQKGKITFDGAVDLGLEAYTNSLQNKGKLDNNWMKVKKEKKNINNKNHRRKIESKRNVNIKTNKEGIENKNDEEIDKFAELFLKKINLKGNEKAVKGMLNRRLESLNYNERSKLLNSIKSKAQGLNKEKKSIVLEILRETLIRNLIRGDDS